VPAKVTGEFEEGDVLFAYAIENANRADFFVPTALILSPESRTILRPEPPSWPCSGCTRSTGEWKCRSNSVLRTSMNMTRRRPHCPHKDTIEREWTGAGENLISWAAHAELGMGI